MNKTLTTQDIAEIKTQAEAWLIEHYPTEQAETILSLLTALRSLIATLEARNAAFDAMLAALKADIKRFEGWDDVHLRPEIIAARSAIAHAEKVKQ